MSVFLEWNHLCVFDMAVEDDEHASGSSSKDGDVLGHAANWE